MQKYIILCTQLLAIRLFRLSHSYTWSVKQDIYNLDPHKKYIYITNHQSRIDPFVIFNSMNYRSVVSTLPIKFMTARSIYYGLLRPLLFCLGCFPTYVKDQNIIDYSAQLVKNGYSLFIFPEGRRTTQSESSPKDGIMRINDQLSSEDVSYILVHIEWTKPGWRRHATLSFREIYSIKHYTPTTLMDEIYSL